MVRRWDNLSIYIWVGHMRTPVIKVMVPLLLLFVFILEVQASGSFPSPGGNLFDDASFSGIEINEEAQFSPLTSSLELTPLAGQKRSSVEVLDLALDDTPASKSLKQSPLLVVEYMDTRTLASRLGSINLDQLSAHLRLLGDAVTEPIKDYCGWNLLHEAVYTDNIPAAQILLAEFNFDPNAFDLYFGSACYLIQSTKMAELLLEFKGNLNNQRSCTLYESVIESARARNKLDLVSLVENLKFRFDRLYAALKVKQAPKTYTVRFKSTRESMFTTALNIISSRRAFSNANLIVSFDNELGVDCGGLSVEFINLIKSKILKRKKILVFNKDLGFYSLKPDLIDGRSVDEIAISNEIKLLGYIVGLSIYHKVPLNIVFSPIMYQIMSGINPHSVDMMAILKETDPVHHRNLRAFVDMPETFISDFDLPQSKDDIKRKWKVNRGIFRSYQDLNEYYPLAALNLVYTPFKKSLAHFKTGLDFAITTEIISNFITPNDLKLVLIGAIDYDAASWRAACVPPTHDAKYNEQYEWFWRVVDEITPKQRSLLLKFVTSLIALPIGGFAALDYQPTVLFNDEPKKLDYLPKSSTCFNQIRLYPVSSYNVMKNNLITVAEFGSAGFGDN